MSNRSPMPVRLILLTDDPLPLDPQALKQVIRPPVEFLWYNELSDATKLRVAPNWELKTDHGPLYMSMLMEPTSHDAQDVYISYMPTGGLEMNHVREMRKAFYERYHIGRREYKPCKIDRREAQITATALALAKNFGGHIASIGHGRGTIDYGISASVHEPVAFREYFFRQVRRYFRLVT